MKITPNPTGIDELDALMRQIAPLIPRCGIADVMNRGERSARNLQMLFDRLSGDTFKAIATNYEISVSRARQVIETQQAILSRCTPTLPSL